MKITWLLCAALAFSVSANAAKHQIEVDYKSFYSHVRKLDNEDTQALQFGFGFQHIHEARLCIIDSATIVTEKHSIPLSVTRENRFTVPSERALKLADAIVRIDVQDKPNQCDMSVQLETKPEYLKAQYSKAELDFLLSQYHAFFNEMGSFLSFMMPQVDGLTLQFADPNLSTQASSAPAIVNGTLMLREAWLAQAKALNLPVAPQRITALTR
ncbi:DUF2987 domain-containing protein [Alteromonas oceanisediminis]|uniref:DUF2987 domain-containing protein n=1 Tax=Alteromonas oceanisediminis TaxID=2836180 RepID=UPI001BD9B702|nr:DUF2987 domain-containing protein [Alteromonas oceanisediminis]MBT0586329.1 DUF2987 domain-containing protein [Alteromonas oceanisediminis]